jgi:hypothetical protein
MRTCRWKRLLAPMLTNELPVVDVLRLRALDGHRLWLERIRECRDYRQDTC